MKRIIDVILSLVGILLLTPFFLLIAILIKLDSKGPVFFRQKRIGLRGEPFRIWKFRTMKIGSEIKGQLTVGSHDERVTKFGLILRNYKIDELPQLFDVLRGKMSIVGPRPEVERYILKYESSVREKILSVRPGITDSASLLMIDENQLLSQFKNAEKGYIDEIMPIKAKIYVNYVNGHTIWGDFKIILKTVIRIFKRKQGKI